MKLFRILKSFQIFKREIKKSKPIAVDVLFKAYQWYHSHVDPIWPEGTFRGSA
jgi:hypothetical protein